MNGEERKTQLVTQLVEVPDYTVDYIVRVSNDIVDNGVNDNTGKLFYGPIKKYDTHFRILLKSLVHWENFRNPDKHENIRSALAKLWKIALDGSENGDTGSAGNKKNIFLRNILEKISGDVNKNAENDREQSLRAREILRTRKKFMCFFLISIFEKNKDDVFAYLVAPENAVLREANYCKLLSCLVFAKEDGQKLKTANELLIAYLDATGFHEQALKSLTGLATSNECHPDTVMAILERRADLKGNALRYLIPCIELDFTEKSGRALGLFLEISKSISTKVAGDIVKILIMAIVSSSSKKEKINTGSLTTALKELATDARFKRMITHEITMRLQQQVPASLENIFKDVITSIKPDYVSAHKTEIYWKHRDGKKSTPIVKRCVIYALGK